MPNLIEVQKASYDQFLMVEEPKGGRGEEGLQAVFKSVFPISDFSNTALLEFVKYTFEPPKYDVDECRQRGMTFAAPLKVTLRLIVFDVDPDTGARSVKDIKEQDVYMGDMPLMTRQRHLHRERHRARHRLADAPLAGRFLRPRQGQDPLFGQAALRGAHHSVSRLLARHRVRRQGHRLRPHRPQAEDPGHLAALCARARRRGDPRHLLQPHHLRARRAGLAGSLRSRAHEGLQGPDRPHRRRHRRGRGRGRQEAYRALGAPARGERAQGATRHRRGPHRPVRRRGPGQRPERGDLRRGRRRDLGQAAGDARRSRRRRAAGARYRSRQCRALHPQHARDRQGVVARGGAVRHLPRDAPRRAADARDGGGDVPLAVLRSRALRPFGSRARQDEHAPRPRRRGHRADAPPRGHDRGRCARSSTCATARARSTTSTISATAASARSASSWRTSTAWVSCAWSARSRSACPRSTSTPSCRRTSSTRSRRPPRCASSSDPRSCRSSWTRPTRSPR